MKLINIVKSYDEKKIFDGFSIEVEKGLPVCLYGPSGCGKTTTLNIISGLTDIEDGGIIGTENKKISYVFQEDRLLQNSTAEENIFISARNYDLAKKIIDICEISKYIDEYPRNLSGGMKRRISIARAVAFDGDIILLDEPFNGIDKLMTEKISKFLKEYLSNKVSVLVTHNIKDAEILNANIIEI